MNLSNNQEFNKLKGNFIEDTIKFIFKWFGILINITAKAIKSLLMSIVGK
jgi:hypothetical protein